MPTGTCVTRRYQVQVDPDPFPTVPDRIQVWLFLTQVPVFAGHRYLRVHPCHALYELESSTACVGCCTGVNGRCRYHRDCTAPKLSVIDVGDILRLAHLLGVPKGDECPPKSLTPEESLDFYGRFYVNRFADMHMHEILYEARQ